MSGMYRAHDEKDGAFFKNIDRKKQACRHRRLRDTLARFSPMVYICAPHGSDEKQNAKNVRTYCRFAVARSCIPVASRLFYAQFMNVTDPAERDLSTYMAMAMLAKCSQLWVFGDTLSAAMALEIYKAETQNIKIRRFTADCKEIGK